MSFRKFMSGEAKKTVWHVSPNSSIYKLKATGRNSGVQAIKQGQAGIYVAPSFMDSIKWWTSYVSGTKLRKLKDRGGFPNEDGSPFKYGYGEAALYEIEIPKSILSKCWYSEDWEKEYFVPEEFIDEMKIISVKKLSSSEIKKIYDNYEKRKQVVRSNQFVKEYQKNFAYKTQEEYKSKFADFRLKTGYSIPKEIESILANLSTMFHEKSDLFSFEKVVKINTPEEIKKINQIRSYLDQFLRQFKIT